MGLFFYFKPPESSVIYVFRFLLVTDEKEDINVATCNNSQSATTTSSLSGLQANRSKAPVSPNMSSTSVKNEPDIKVPIHALSNDPEEAYTLYMASNNWYLFLRLHHILCERLTKMYDRAVALAEEESKYKQQRKESTAIALRLKPKSKFTLCYNTTGIAFIDQLSY